MPQWTQNRDECPFTTRLEVCSPELNAVKYGNCEGTNLSGNNGQICRPVLVLSKPTKRRNKDLPPQAMCLNT